MNKPSRVVDEDWVNEEMSPRRLSPEEHEGVLQAIASLEEVGGIPFDEVVAWLDSLDTDHELPRPLPRKF